jgi:hypothetical protein
MRSTFSIVPTHFRDIQSSLLSNNMDRKLIYNHPVLRACLCFFLFLRKFVALPYESKALGTAKQRQTLRRIHLSVGEETGALLLDGVSDMTGQVQNETSPQCRGKVKVIHEFHSCTCRVRVGCVAV